MFGEGFDLPQLKIAHTRYGLYLKQHHLQSQNIQTMLDVEIWPEEGTNNKIKTMKRQAYGFRDQEFFKLKILALHETKYALVG